MRYQEPHHFAYDILVGFRQMAEPAGFDVAGVDKNAVTAQQGVADFVARAVKIVVISGIDVTDATGRAGTRR